MILQSLRLDLELRGYKASTIREYERTLSALVTDGNLSLPLNRLAVAHWIQEARTPSTRRHRYLAINALCRMLVEEQELEVNPCSKIPMPKEHVKPQPILSEVDLKKLLASCDSSYFGVRDKAVMQILACTGCRMNELVSLTVDDINLETAQMMIRQGKNNTWRVAYLDAPAKKALLRYLRVRKPKNETLFGMSKAAVKQMLDKRSATVGVHVTAHQFRRRFASQWLLNGGSQIGLMNVAGWTSVAMPARYTALAAQEIARREWERMQ